MFIVRPDGSVAVDNLDDAFMLARRIASPELADSPRARAQRLTVADLKALPEAERWRRFWTKCGRPQRIVLREIKTHAGVTIFELATAIERKPSSVGGIVSTLVRLARGFGYDQAELFLRKDDLADGVRRIRFVPGPALEAADVALMI